jgi:hypothetical protein
MASGFLVNFAQASTARECHSSVGRRRDHNSNEYFELLRPYIAKGGNDGKAGNSNSSSNDSGNVNHNSDELVSSYEILGVRRNATAEEVKSAYRDLAKVWYPDRFSKENERLRKKAEEQFKRIQDNMATAELIPALRALSAVALRSHFRHHSSCTQRHPPQYVAGVQDR